jgi:aminoglycoside 3-N-acetyltransferase I
MAEVFGEGAEPLSDSYVDRLLDRDAFWAFAAFDGEEIVGGLTAHELPMTRAEARELFIYDIAVHADHRRRGIGRQLVRAVRDAAAHAGLDVVFVAADLDDTHALDFYRALGGAPSSVVMFTFGEVGPSDSTRPSR